MHNNECECLYRQELTVKGLEQEINKIHSDHQKEIMELKRQHQQNILDTVEEARQKHEVAEMSIRESYAHDREAAIEKERNAIRERFERQIEIEQKSFEEQRSRQIGEFNGEKERWLNEHRQKEHEFEVRRDKMQQEKKELVEHLHREFADKMRIIEIRNQVRNGGKSIVNRDVSINQIHFVTSFLPISRRSHRFVNNLNRISPFGNVNTKRCINYAKLKVPMRYGSSVV